MALTIARKLSLATDAAPASTTVAYTQPVALGGHDTCSVTATVMVLEGNPSGQPTTLESALEQSFDLTNWKEVSGLYAFEEIGVATVSFGNMVGGYVRLRITLINGDSEDDVDGLAVVSAVVSLSTL